ncbi:MAG: histidine kinase [Desulfococcus sp. 4484_241]|nr:MAG: histidine kinase [Desulfococcus sp. 4484_241]
MSHNHQRESGEERDAVDDLENIPLRSRPSISIRARIVTSFSLFILFCFAITCWSYWILSEMEKKIEFLEIVGKYMVEIQQARRFEKNYLLYGTNLDDALMHLGTADTILKRHSRTIRHILGAQHLKTIMENLSEYRKQLEMVGRTEREAAIQSLEPKLREYGGQMVSFADEIVKKEQKDVARMLLLAKRGPIFFVFVLIVMMFFVGNALIRQLMMALKRFMDYTKRIGEGDFSPIMPARKYRDEFTSLAEAFNRMIRELNHRQEVLIESHKLRAIGTLVAGVAHELNNPLNNSLLTASLLKEDFHTLTDEEKMEMIDDLISETERSQSIVKRLLDFARESKTSIKSLDLVEIVNESIRLVGNQIKLAKIRLDVDFEENLPRIHGDEQMLKQVFVNLLLNAIDAADKRGRVQISVRKDPESNYLLVTVKDNGPGIPEHLQSRIFEPFFTTKAQGKGTGLGLSVSQGIVRKLGGYIRLDESTQDGTSFTVSLPITYSPSEIMSR